MTFITGIFSACSIQYEPNILLLYFRKTRGTVAIPSHYSCHINSLEGQILTVESDIIQRWLTYFEGLLNTENTRKQIESGLATEGPIDIFNENEVSEQLGKMGLDKATGPDDLPIEAVKILAKQDIMYVVEAMNQVLQQGIPEIWRKSRMVPIYKGKGDILECNNYRGIKLMCHETMGTINRGEVATNNIDRQHTVWFPPWKVYN